MLSKMDQIKLKGIKKSYGKELAVHNLDLTVNSGAFLTILGPSGCGKTTMLNIVSGLVRPTEGKILFDDKEVTNLKTEERNIAQVFQFPVIYSTCLLYTSPSPRDLSTSRMPSSA